MKKQISIFGKSTVSKSNKGYKLIEQLSYELVKIDYACMHGGYAGGIMEAVANGANKACLEGMKDQSIFNIGVPELRFDEKWSRVKSAHFTNPARDIFDRLRTITSSEIFIVASEGGDGTFLELDLVVHENLINEILDKPVKHLIFIESENKQWSKLFNSRLENLDISKKNFSDYPWINFVSFNKYSDTSEVVSEILGKIKQIY